MSEPERAWPVKRTTSYGGVVVQQSDDPTVVMIRPSGKKKIWALPKGGREEGETPEQAAVREVREETGLEAEVIKALSPITYWFSWTPEKVRYRKTVHFFLMRPIGGDPEDHDDEVAAVEFVPAATAVKRASYSTEKKVLRQALAELA